MDAEIKSKPIVSTKRNLQSLVQNSLPFLSMAYVSPELKMKQQSKIQAGSPETPAENPTDI